MAFGPCLLLKSRELLVNLTNVGVGVGVAGDFISATRWIGTALLRSLQLGGENMIDRYHSE
jgi:hypothetical protein